MLKYDGILLPSESFDDNPDENALLKKALLLFDRLYAIVPKSFHLKIENSIRLYLYRYHPKGLSSCDHSIAHCISERDPRSVERHERIISFLKDTEIFKKADILELVFPDENIKSSPVYWDTNRPAQEQWQTIKERFEEIKNELSVEEAQNHTPHLLYGNIMADLQDPHFRKIAYNNFPFKRVTMFKGQAEANWMYLIGNESGYPEDIPEDLHNDIFAMMISTPMWASLLINHTLISSFRKKATPICTNKTFQQLLNRKLTRCYDRIRDFKESEPHFINDLKTQYLALDVLPNFELKSYEDVLEMRFRLEDELLGFREHIGTLTNEIKSTPFNESFSKHLELVKRDKVIPSIKNLKRKMSELESNTFKLTMLSTGICVGFIIYPIVNPALMLLLGGGFSLPQILVNYKKKRSQLKENNGLSILLEFDK